LFDQWVGHAFYCLPKVKCGGCRITYGGRRPGLAWPGCCWIDQCSRTKQPLSTFWSNRSPNPWWRHILFRLLRVCVRDKTGHHALPTPTLFLFPTTPAVTLQPHTPLAVRSSPPSALAESAQARLGVQEGGGRLDSSRTQTPCGWPHYVPSDCHKRQFSMQPRRRGEGGRRRGALDQDAPAPLGPVIGEHGGLRQQQCLAPKTAVWRLSSNGQQQQQQHSKSIRRFRRRSFLRPQIGEHRVVWFTGMHSIRSI
jgi:hypothetical protein